MGNASVSQVVDYEGYSSEYAYATISWDDNGKVTVTIDSGNVLTWRIRGKNPDTKEYLVVTGGGTTGEFTATNGKTYYFQIYSQTYGKYSDGASFTVKFGEDSGGDSGSGDSGGGSSGYETSYLWVLAEEGANISVKRTYTNNGNEVDGSYIGNLTFDMTDIDEYGTWKGCKIWYQDQFEITATASIGYKIDTYQYEGHTFNFEVDALEYHELNNVWEFIDNYGTEPYIYAGAAPIATVHIYNDSTKQWGTYTPHIYDDFAKQWDIYSPFVYNDSTKQWDIYS